MSASDLPEPAFRLVWKPFEGVYKVTKPNIGDTDCFTADQLRAYGDKRAMEAVEAEYQRGYADGLSSAAFYVTDHCQHGEEHAAVIIALKHPSAPTQGEKTLCPSCGHDVNSPLCPCDPPVPGGQP